MVVLLSLTYAPGYVDLTHGGEELDDVKSLRILVVTFNSKLTFETHLREVVSKAAMSLGFVRRTGKLFDCPRVLKSCFKAYILPYLEYYASVWMSSAESHLCLLDSVACGWICIGVGFVVYGKE